MSRTPVIGGRALRARMRRHLDAFSRLEVDDPALRRAAVAIVVVEDGDDSEPAFLLTRRGGRLRRHRGQWALPGGRLDDGEDVVDAARRELAEELGLALGAERVLGVLDEYPTRSGFRITPVVLWCGALPELTLDPHEVQAVYSVALRDLEHPQVPRLERIPQSDRPVLSIRFDTIGQRVYAPTAAMLYQFREVALHGRPTRVRDYDEPLFAWR